MEMLAVLLALFVYQITIVQSQITIPYTSWSCNAAQNNPEPLSIDFLRNENTDLVTSNKIKLNCNLNNNNYIKKSKIHTQGQTKEALINLQEGEQSKHSVDKTALLSPTKPAIDFLSIPNSITSQNHLPIQNFNPKEKMKPQVSSLPLIDISKFDMSNALSTKYSDINYCDPTMVSPLNKLKGSTYTEDLYANKDLIASKLYTVIEPTNKSMVNRDVSRSKDYLSVCNANTKPYVPVIASDVNTIETPMSHTLFPQWLLTNQNRNKIYNDTTAQLALNIKQNPLTTAPNILSDTVLPNVQNFYAHKDITAKSNNVPTPVKFTVNCDANCALVFPFDGNSEKMNHVPMCPAVITSDIKNIETPNYKIITPQFPLQDRYISKQQSGISPEIASNIKEKLIPGPSIILDNIVENLSMNKDTDSAKLSCTSSVTLPSHSLIINNDLNFVKAYILQNKPTINTVTTSELKKVEMPIPQIHTSQLTFADENKDKKQIVTSEKLATNIKENFISALPNILADATIKAVKIASPLLNDKGIYVASNLLNNHMQNLDSKIENLSPITEKTKENMSNVVIPNIQMNLMPIINNNMAPVTQLNLKSYELQNEQSNGKCVRSLQMPHIIPITLSVPAESREIVNFGLHQSNELYKSLNTISIPQTTSTYIGPVSVPPDLSVYKTWSDKYTNCLRNSLNQFVSVLTSNILSAFKENRAPHKTFDTSIKPVTKSNDISSCIITQTPNSLNLPVFSLSPPLVESPKSLPRPKLNLDVANTSNAKISSKSENSRSKASSQPYISSITINLSPSKDTKNNIIIVT